MKSNVKGVFYDNQDNQGYWKAQWHESGIKQQAYFSISLHGDKALAMALHLRKRVGELGLTDRYLELSAPRDRYLELQIDTSSEAWDAYQEAVSNHMPDEDVRKWALKKGDKIVSDSMA